MNREMICRVEKWLHLRPALSVPVLCLSLAYYLSEGRMKGVAAKEFVETLQLGEYTFCTDLWLRKFIASRRDLVFCKKLFRYLSARWSLGIRMTDNSNFALRWEINNATASVNDGSGESEVFNEEGFEWYFNFVVDTMLEDVHKKCLTSGKSDSIETNSMWVWSISLSLVIIQEKENGNVERISNAKLASRNIRFILLHSAHIIVTFLDANIFHGWNEGTRSMLDC